MAGWDWGVIVAYFLSLVGLTWYSVRKNRDTADDYFLAGRNLGWFIVAASIFSSNIGSEHLVGLAGSGCTDGVAMAHYELHAWCLLVLAWVFVPFYARSMVFTMPEFLERRYSPTARWLLSIISLVAYVVTKIAVGIFAGGVVFSNSAARNAAQLGLGMTLDAFWIGSFAVVMMTGLYTMIGGLRAVAYTDTLQTIIFIVGSALVTVFGLIELGGWQELRHACGSNMFNLWKPLGARRHGRLPGPRSKKAGASPGISTTSSPGWACCSAPRSSGCGTGVPTSTSCSARWPRRTRRSPGGGASPRR